MGIEVQAPHKYDGMKRPLVFLAGSIEMGAAEEWQRKIIDLLPRDCTILNPRRDDWDSSWEQKATHQKFREQVTWELRGLDNADIVLLYIDPNTKAPISLLELGAHRNNIVVCCPEGFWRKGNVDIFCQYYGIPQVDTLEELAEDVWRYIRDAERS